MKLLLTSVFGPYGVNDEYGRKDNKMELFHNQITREQGIFSYRFHHNSFGLFFLAENLETPSTVLDFPSLDVFRKELEKRYEYIGISFIIPNFKKTQKMIEIIREVSPESKIILGGHGVNIPDIKSRIDADYFCKGDGVVFLRKLFKEDIYAPITHPLVHSSFNRKVMGVPLPKTSGVLIPGVGCPNKCRFCATTHFFNDYTPYLQTGRDIFDVCCRYEDELGVTDFGVLDENFLKMKERALELLEIMEREQRFFTFSIFSSAETLEAIGDLDILVRLGVHLIWLGVESKQEVYTKNKGVDFHALVVELRKRGISVLASSILFLEHHDQNTIMDDIDFSISLNPDYLQFMQLGPIPGTALYEDYENKGTLLLDVPYEEQHGQDQIWFKHPHFTPKESYDFLKMAFKRDYDTNGASFLRTIKTNLMGYEYCINHRDSSIVNHAKPFLEQVKLMRYFLFTIQIFKENIATKKLLAEVRDDFLRLLGKPSWKSRFFSILIPFFSIKEKIREMFWKTKQPNMMKKNFHKAKIQNINPKRNSA